MNTIPVSSQANTFSTFGDFLKYLRRRAHLTQLELSIAVGYSEAQISRLEKNLRLPDLTALKALFIPALHLEDEPQLTERFLALAQSARQEDAPAAGLSPYKGLLFFDEADAELFFGREALTAHLAEHVMDLAIDASSRFLTIVGASGSGKSSLTRAGLAVALKRAGWEVQVFTPTAVPMWQLERILQSTSVGGAERALILVDQFEELFTLCRDELERIAFIDTLLACARDQSKRISVVIALRADFYSYCALYPLLRQAVATEQEYIGQMTLEELRCAIEEPARHGGWEFEPGLVDILLQDVGAQGSQEPEPGALPLLSHALLATWERRRGRTLTLEGYRASGGVQSAIAETAESVFTDQLNQTQQELARDVFLRLTELGEGTEDTRRRAALNELARQSGEAPQLRGVLNTLAEARLITLNEDSAEVSHEALIREWQRLRQWLTQDREGLLLLRHLTESAHDWERRGHDPADLYRGARLAQSREWADANEERLNAVEQAFLAASIEQEEHEVLDREAQRQRELEAAQKLAETQSRAAKQLRRRAIFLAGAFALAMILAGFALFFGNQASKNAATAKINAISAQQNADTANANARHAESEKQIAISRELAGASLVNLNIDPERSILLALQAEKHADTFQAQDALHRAVQTSRLLKRVDVPLGGCYCSMAFSPDGSRLVTESRDAQGQLTTQIRDAATLEVLFSKPGIWADDRWLDANYLPIAKPSDDRSSTIITVWDATGQKVITTITLPIYYDDNGPFVDISPDHTKVAAVSSEDRGNLSVYDMSTGKMLPHVGKPGYAYNGMIRFSPDSKSLLTIGALTDNDQETTLWDVATGHELLTVPARSSPSLIDFSPNGRWFAVDELQTVRIVDISSGHDIATLSGHTALVQSGLQFNKDGTRIVTVAGDGTTRIWDSATGQSLLTIFGNDPQIRTAAFNSEGTEVATLSSTSLQTWAVMPTEPHEWLAMPSIVDCYCMIAYSPDGKQLAAFGDDNTVKIIDSHTGQTILALPDPDNQGRGLAFSPDGRRLAITGNDTMVHVWNLLTGKELLVLKGASAPMDRLVYSPDGKRLATIDRSHEARLWDAVSGQILFTMHAFDGEIQESQNVGIAFSPDGSRLATAGQMFVKIWDTSTGRELLALPYTPEVLAYTVSFSPDGKHLAVGFRSAPPSVWDVATGQKLFDMFGHTGSVRHIAYSPDGTRIATASTDGTTRLWDAATGAEQFSLAGQASVVTGLAFSPDGTRLATTSRDGITRVYALNLKDLIQIVSSHLTRELRLEECQQYLHVPACPPGS